MYRSLSLKSWRDASIANSSPLLGNDRTRISLSIMQNRDEEDLLGGSVSCFTTGSRRGE